MDGPHDPKAPTVHGEEGKKKRKRAAPHNAYELDKATRREPPFRKSRSIDEQASVCQHNHVRSQRKKCRGPRTCPHQRQKSKCKECGGASICQHQRVRSVCKECGGASICQHQRERNTCRECGGSSICQHQRRRSQCKQCRADADESLPDGLEELERA